MDGVDSTAGVSMEKKVIVLAQAAPEAALRGLNRLTGLSFSSWPESLVNPSPNGTGPGSGEMEEGDALVAKYGDQREKKQA